MPDSAVRLVARAERRRRRWSLLALGAVFGLVGGIVLGAAALGERTATAYPRLVEAVHLDDARVIVARDQPRTIAALPTLPGVTDSYLADTYALAMDGGAVRYVSMIAGTAAHPDLLTPVLVAGREPDPASPDEVVVSEQIAQAGGFGIGAELTGRMLTLRNFADFAVGFTPAGPPARIHVVGVARMPKWGGDLPDVVGGPGFARAHPDGPIGVAAYVRLAPGSLPAFTAAVKQATAAEPSIAQQYLVTTPETPRLTADPSVEAAERALLVGIGLFGLVVALGAVQLLGLGLLRTAAAAREARRIEAALGMTLRGSLQARVLAAAPAAGLAGVLGAGVVVLAGLVQPIGSTARFEPDPGFRVSWALVGGGGALLALVFLLATAATAALAWRRRPVEAAEPVPVVATLSSTVGGAFRRWPALLLGSRLARQSGPRRGLPVLAVIAAAAAVAGIVATVVVGASLDRLVSDPARWAGDSAAVLPDVRPGQVDTLLADPRVTTLTVVLSGSVHTPDGETLSMATLDTPAGPPPGRLLSGRLPAAADETAVSPRLASERGLAAGSVVAVLDPAGAPHPLRVVGTVVAPQDNRDVIGQDLVVDRPTLAAMVPVTQDTAFVGARPDAADALRAELSAAQEVTPQVVPAAIRNLADLGRLPDILAVVLALVAGTGLAHSLRVTARRLAPEMAVFAVLGATPAMVRTTLTVLAATTAVPAVLVGVPVGIGVARLFWWQVTSAIGVGSDVAVPVGPLTLLVVLVPVAAALVTLVPALRAVRAPAVLAAW